jgi:hypothetical protein
MNMVLKYIVLSLIVLAITLSDAKNTIWGNLIRWSIYWYGCMKYFQWIFDNMDDESYNDENDDESYNDENNDENDDENEDIFDSDSSYGNEVKSNNDKSNNDESNNDESNNDESEKSNDNDSSYEPSNNSSDNSSDFEKTPTKPTRNSTNNSTNQINHRPVTRSMTLEQ